MSEENDIAPPPPIPPAAEAPPPSAPEPAKAAPKSKRKAKSKTGRFRAKRVPLRNGYQGITVPAVGDALLERDNWVEVQLKAGLIEEV